MSFILVNAINYTALLLFILLSFFVVQVCSNPWQIQPAQTVLNTDTFRNIPAKSVFSVSYNDGSNDSVGILKSKESVKTCLAQIQTIGPMREACSSQYAGRLEKGTKVRIISSDNMQHGWSMIQALTGKDKGLKGMIYNLQLANQID